MFLLRPPLCAFDPFVGVPNAFSVPEAKKLRDLMTEGTFPGLVGDSVQEEDRDWRKSYIKRLYPHEAENSWVFERLAYLVNEVNPRNFGLDLDGFEAIQLTEYDSDYQGFYGMHCDCSYSMTSQARRKLSITVQLSDPSEYVGGELRLYPHTLKEYDTAPKELGAMTLFRSHIIHEVLPVTEGKRYSLVAWANGPLPR